METREMARSPKEIFMMIWEMHIPLRFVISPLIN